MEGARQRRDILTRGACRCCAAAGYHRELMKEYNFEGNREVYAEIFMECFNINLDTHNTSNLICSSCIHRLRDANSFREMVLAGQRALQDVDPLQRGEFAQVVNLLNDGDEVVVKVEELKTECRSDDDDDDDYVPDDSGDYGDPPSSPPSPDAREAALLARYPGATLRPRAPPGFLQHCHRLRDKIITARDVEKILIEQESMAAKLDISSNYITEKRAHIINISTMIENSNVTPFRSKTTHGYPCFYCRKALGTLEELKSHTNQDHKSIDVKKFLYKYGPENIVVNVDVTDLKCKICDSKIANLSELKKHLNQTHKKQMCLKYTDRLVPFKLEKDLVCQICDGTFQTFGAVERHMNLHFRNYVCKECGTGFITKYRLKVHVKSIHVGGNYPCEVCGKVFPSYQKKKTHTDAVHKLFKRFKCPKCSVRFTEYFARQRHLVEVHGAAPIKYKCNVCDREFDRKYNLSRHLKKDHLKEKNNECETCGYTCFTVTELKVHMIKHVGERTHECDVCKKAYARKKTLKEHMKIHTNDRRHVCAVCGQAFIQKCSLKGHIKTHHPELNME
ncbi:unnamed protein product [Plutella xylostella]|nr:unnamed protein product [Plutella xylostella]